jgi:stage V sporulation protein SpoVS
VAKTSADPKRPYKTYAAIVSAFLTSLLVTNATELGAVGVGLVTAAVAAIAVYVTPNPEI